MQDQDAPMVDSVSPRRIPCRHLRSKAMYVYTDGISGGPRDDDDDNSIYWCLKTMTSFGPDDAFVDSRDCKSSGRECYEPM